MTHRGGHVHVAEVPADRGPILLESDKLRLALQKGPADPRLADPEMSYAKGVIRALNCVVRAHDPYTAHHQKRVSKLAALTARALGLDERAVFFIELGGLAHDIGKLMVPVELLVRPGPLNDEEMAVMRAHGAKGAAILWQLGLPDDICTTVLQHHERIDGSGYPAGIEGDEVLLASQIVALTDVFDAISQARPYRAGLGRQGAAEELEEGAGSRYSTDLVATFLRSVIGQGELASR